MRHLHSVSEVFGFEKHMACDLPLFTARVAAGFPSPADDFIDKKLDLNELLVKHPAATFFVRVEGHSMVGAGIRHGDLLIVDRALEPVDNRIVIAVLNGDLTVKRVRKTQDKLLLVPENPDFAPIAVTEEMNCEVWGVVTHVIHAV